MAEALSLSLCLRYPNLHGRTQRRKHNPGGGGGGEETRPGTEKRCSHNLKSDPQ